MNNEININNNAEEIEDFETRIIRAEEEYDRQKEEKILGERE